MESSELNAMTEVLTIEIGKLKKQQTSIIRQASKSRTVARNYKLGDKAFSVEVIIGSLEAILWLFEELKKMKDKDGKLPKLKFFRFSVIRQYARLLWGFTKKVIKIVK